VNRTVWFVAGVGAGIYAMVRGRRAAEIFTADGLHDRMQALGVGARLFREEVAQGKAEKETELRERLTASYDARRQLAAANPADTPPAPLGPTNDALPDAANERGRQ
jgi:hypothetical protein